MKSPWKRFRNFLWKSTGRTPDELADGDRKERRKFFTFGLYILLTSCLAGYSAFYAATQAFHSGPAALVTGLFFGIVIYLIYRYMVLVLGYRIGLVKGRTEPVLQYLPRLILAGIFGVCIAKPLELAVFARSLENHAGELKAEIYAGQEALLKARFASIEEDQAEMDSLQAQLDTLSQRIALLDNQISAADTNPGLKVLLTQRQTSFQEDYELLKPHHEERIDRLKQSVAKRSADRDKEYQLIRNKADASFSLLNQIRLQHRKHPYGWIFSIFITLFYTLPILNLYRFVRFMVWFTAIGTFLFAFFTLIYVLLLAISGG